MTECSIERKDVIHSAGMTYILPGPLATAQACVVVLSGLLLPCLSGELLLDVPGLRSWNTPTEAYTNSSETDMVVFDDN